MREQTAKAFASRVQLPLPRYWERARGGGSRIHAFTIHASPDYNVQRIRRLRRGRARQLVRNGDVSPSSCSRRRSRVEQRDPALNAGSTSCTTMPAAIRAVCRRGHCEAFRFAERPARVVRRDGDQQWQPLFQTTGRPRYRVGVPVQAGRAGHFRQDQHARVRTDHHYRADAVRPYAQPVAGAAYGGRLERRRGRSSSGRTRTGGARFRRRRLHPHSGFLLRRLRAQAQPRAQPPRAGPGRGLVRHEHRTCRHALGARQRRAAGPDMRAQTSVRPISQPRLVNRTRANWGQCWTAARCLATRTPAGEKIAPECERR